MQWHSVLIVSMLCAPVAWAENLVDICHDALKQDPVYRSARAEWQVKQQTLPLAKTAFLPSMNINFNQDRVRMRSADISGHHDFDQRQWSINLSQTIFDARAWNKLAHAGYEVRQAGATLAAATQSVLLRAAQQYFNVIMAAEQLKVFKAEQRAMAQQYRLAKQRLKAGIVTRMTVLDAKAKYDITRADALVAYYQLQDERAALTQITGQQYAQLMALGRHLPLVPPVPRIATPWVQQAREHNYLLKAAQMAQQSAKTGVLTAESGHVPRVMLTGSVTDVQKPIYNSTSQAYIKVKSRAAVASLGVALPVLEGGRVILETERARAQYQQATAHALQVMRQVSADAQRYLTGLLSGIQTIRARHRALISSQAALSANQSAYLVGTRTVVDVLSALAAYSQAQRDYRSARYHYLNTVLALKYVSGLLKGDDVMVMSTWLKQPIALNQLKV